MEGDTCFFSQGTFCYRHLKQTGSDLLCTNCDKYIKRSCQDCRLYGDKVCEGNKKKIACDNFERTLGWVFDEKYTN